MYSNDRFRDITDMEFFLFGGVPETPEPVFERDIQSHSELHRTRGAQHNRRSGHVHFAGEILETLSVSLDADPIFGSISEQE